mgnify:CR=1 FL=1
MDKEQAMICEQELKKLAQEVGHSFLDIGQKLLECRRAQWYKLLGFDTFDAFVERSLQMSGRAGRYYARVHEFYIEKNECPVERLVQLGWTKLEKLLPILEGKTRADHAMEFIRWFSYAELHTVRELEVEILSHLSPEEKEKSGLRTAYTVPVTEGQRDVLNQAVEVVKKQTGNNDPGTALEYLAADFLSGAQPILALPTPIEEAGITRTFHLTYEQDVVVQKALFVIRSSSKESDTDALVRLCQLYLKSGLGKVLERAA